MTSNLRAYAYDLDSLDDLELLLGYDGTCPRHDIVAPSYPKRSSIVPECPNMRMPKDASVARVSFNNSSNNDDNSSNNNYNNNNNNNDNNLKAKASCRRPQKIEKCNAVINHHGKHRDSGINSLEFWHVGILTRWHSCWHFDILYFDMLAFWHFSILTCCYHYH